jgi:hypothetical protein
VAASTSAKTVLDTGVGGADHHGDHKRIATHHRGINHERRRLTPALTNVQRPDLLVI